VEVKYSEIFDADLAVNTSVASTGVLRAALHPAHTSARRVSRADHVLASASVKRCFVFGEKASIEPVTHSRILLLT
jgi:hypothetical protein